MPRGAITRDRLARTALQIAYREGIGSVSMRKLASSCGISVGSIYNYFPTKSDLLFAVIERFWEDAFHGGSCNPEAGERFGAFCRRLYGVLYQGATHFRQEFLAELAALSISERNEGRARESALFTHIKVGIDHVIESDDSIDPRTWSDGLTPEALAEFVFRGMMSSLRAGEADIEVLACIIERALFFEASSQGKDGRVS